MNTNADFDRNAAAWLADGPTELADRVLDAALREVHLTPQRRRWSAPWRASLMSLRLTAAAVIAVVAIAGILAFNLIGGVGPQPTAAPPTSTTAPSVAPTSTSAAIASLQPATFTTYTSAQYGFAIGHPTSWTETPATRAWSFDTDSDETAPSSAGADHFTSSNGQVRVSAWDVAVGSPINVDSRPELLAWITDYCTRTGASTCAGIQDRAVFFCNEPRDCHNAYVVPFDDWVGAFFLGTDATMRVVAVWRAENDPAVAPYGGARALLKAFLWTLHVVPPTPEQLNGTAP